MDRIQAFLRAAWAFLLRHWRWSLLGLIAVSSIAWLLLRGDDGPPHLFGWRKLFVVVGVLLANTILEALRGGPEQEQEEREEEAEQQVQEGQQQAQQPAGRVQRVRRVIVQAARHITIPEGYPAKGALALTGFYYFQWIWSYTNWLVNTAGWSRPEALLLLSATCVLGVLAVVLAFWKKDLVRAALVFAGLVILWNGIGWWAQGGVNYLPKSGKSNVVYCKVDGEEFRADQKNWKACPEHGKTVVRKQDDVQVWWCEQDSTTYLGSVWAGRSVSRTATFKTAKAVVRRDTLYTLQLASAETRKALEFSHHLVWRRPRAEIGSAILSFIGLDPHSSKASHVANIVLNALFVIVVVSLLRKYGVIPSGWMGTRYMPLVWIGMVVGGFFLLRMMGPNITIPKDVWHPTTQTWVVGRAIAMLALALGLGAGIFHVLTNAGLPKPGRGN